MSAFTAINRYSDAALSAANGQRRRPRKMGGGAPAYDPLEMIRLQGEQALRMQAQQHEHLMALTTAQSESARRQRGDASNTDLAKTAMATGVPANLPGNAGSGAPLSGQGGPPTMEEVYRQRQATEKARQGANAAEDARMAEDAKRNRAITAMKQAENPNPTGSATTQLLPGTPEPLPPWRQELQNTKDAYGAQLKYGLSPEDMKNERNPIQAGVIPAEAVPGLSVDQYERMNAGKTATSDQILGYRGYMASMQPGGGQEPAVNLPQGKTLPPEVTFGGPETTYPQTRTMPATPAAVAPGLPPPVPGPAAQKQPTPDGQWTGYPNWPTYRAPGSVAPAPISPAPVPAPAPVVSAPAAPAAPVAKPELYVRQTPPTPGTEGAGITRLPDGTVIVAKRPETPTEAAMRVIAEGKTRENLTGYLKPVTDTMTYVEAQTPYSSMTGGGFSHDIAAIASKVLPEVEGMDDIQKAAFARRFATLPLYDKLKGDVAKGYEPSVLFGGRAAGSWFATEAKARETLSHMQKLVDMVERYRTAAPPPGQVPPSAPTAAMPGIR